MGEKGAEEYFCARFRPLALFFARSPFRFRARHVAKPWQGVFERPKIRPSPFKLKPTLMHYKRCAESNAAVFGTWEGAEVGEKLETKLNKDSGDESPEQE